MNSSVLLVAPDLLHYEFSHVLTRYVRNRKVTPAHAGQLLDALLALKIDLVDDDELHRQSLALSMSNPGLSGYDAQYLAVSERSGAELWTADKGLAAISQGLGLSTRLWITAPSA
jgi:predicted nucleic acid-binding protein